MQGTPEAGSPELRASVCGESGPILVERGLSGIQNHTDHCFLLSTQLGSKTSLAQAMTLQLWSIKTPLSSDVSL